MLAFQWVHLSYTNQLILNSYLYTPSLKVKVALLCPLWDPMDCSPWGSSVRWLLQARMLKWVSISFSRESSWPRDWTQVFCIAGRCFNLWATREALWKVKVKLLSHVWLFVTPWTVAHQAPPLTGLSRQEYWSGLPFPSPGDLPNPGIEPRSPALKADALTSEPPGKL